MENQKVYEALLQIHKVLGRIAQSLEALEKVAYAEHPEAFKPLDRPPARVSRS
jgi:hypothetical protein